MFGTLRYILAMCVVLGHLRPTGMVWPASHYAVFTFYALSGYLITHILNTVYPPTREGLVRFALNRALRIYPAYYAVLALSIIILLFLPPEAVSFSPVLQWPDSLRGWLANIFIFGIAPEKDEIASNFRFVDNSWSLAVELCYYVLLAVGFARSRWLIALWLAVSLMFTGWQLYHGASFFERYALTTAGALPFSLGALLWHMLRRFPLKPKPASTIFLLGATIWLTTLVAAMHGALEAKIYDFYIALIGGLGLIAGLSMLTPSICPRFAKADKWLGHLSYPIFLCHNDAAIIMLAFFSSVSRNDWSLFLAALPLIHLLAIGIAYGIEKPLQGWRGRIRPRPTTPLSPVQAQAG